MQTGDTPAVCPGMTGWERFKMRTQAAIMPLVGIHCSEQREKGERYVTTTCAATYP